MHLRRRLKLQLLTTALLLGAAGTASAYHSEEERITDDTAYTLGAKRLRLGLLKFQYGVWDPLTAGSYTAPWVVRMANLHLKWRYYFEDPWSLALQVGAYRLDVSKLEVFEDVPGDAIISVGTFEPSVSYRFNSRFTLSASVPYTEVRANGTVNIDAFEGALTGAVDNLQFATTFEWRLTRVTALVLHARYLIFQRVFGDGSITLHPDEFTTVRIDADAESEALDFNGAWSVVPAVAFSWKSFNLRAGVGYGNWSISPINFVLPRKTLVPEFDLFWVF
ncbi:MAG TPA: hypothetical protein PKA88_32980 [Polyangiaceae bacterium]|nr:hypothetical protein [Polyangiaceae bacterium]HMR79462.1 hypothetical protein [Polyangiaceae bacterium]